VAVRRPTRRQVVVVIALSVGLLHFATGPHYGGPLRRFVNGYLIDILLPLAAYLLLSLPTRPIELSRIARAAIVLGVGVAVEVLQFLGIAIFGRTYDPVDFAMYGLGVLGGMVLEWGVLSRLDSGERTTQRRPAV
jgi:hypothetical protein